MADTAITAVLSKFGELATREAEVLLQVGNDIMLLRDRLEWLQAFIRDADRKRRLGSDDFRRVWVRQTRDVAFEAEDALDEFFHKVDLDSQGYRGWKIWLRYFTGCTTQLTVRHSLSGQIKSIRTRLDQISDNHTEYKIDHTPPGIWTSSVTALATWDNLHTKVVGFDKHSETLEYLVLHSRNVCRQQMFVSILGESGIGKSTLVNKIYSQANIRPLQQEQLLQLQPKEEQPITLDTFDVKIWYDMPPDSSTEDFLKEVYERVAEEIVDTPNSEVNDESIDIAYKICSVLHKKEYLVILGGITSKTILNCVRASLPDDQNGSRVVLILEPEGEDISKYADTLNTKLHPGTTNISSTTINISRLDRDHSGYLFNLRVFGDKNPAIKDASRSKYEQDVYDISGGHPLAIVVLAGLLRSKEKPVEWDAVLQQLKTGPEAEGNQGNQITGVLFSKDRPNIEWDALLQQLNPPREATKLSNRMAIERIFSMSFDDLPHDIKSCFLYFAAYPKNITLSADQIIRMWVAEGFIKPQKGKTTEELGQVYLKELVSRCLVEMEERNANGDVEIVKVHSRLLEFLQSEAREASFIEVHDRNDVLAPAVVRRLSIQNDSGSYSGFSGKFPKLRSFICRVEGEGQGSSASASLKYRPNHDLKFLCGSKFLRVISVKGLRLQELPKEIGDLIHLRYLRVACHDLRKLPSSIRRLLNLQTLDISETGVEHIDLNFWKIKVLRHVLAKSLTLPKSIFNELDELQTLHGVKPAAEAWEVGRCPLDKMTKLRSVELHGIQAVHGDALAIALEKIHLLGHLKLKGDEIPSCVFTAPSLRCLQTLELDGNVKWQEISPDVCNLRPNLLRLKPRNINDVPPEIRERLRDIEIVQD